MRSAHAAGPNRSGVTHGTGTATDIPDQPYDLYNNIYRCKKMVDDNNYTCDSIAASAEIALLTMYANDCRMLTAK